MCLVGYTIVVRISVLGLGTGEHMCIVYSHIHTLLILHLVLYSVVLFIFISVLRPGMRRRGCGRTHSVTVSRRYMHSGACCKSHFYGSGIWVNVPKGRYDAFFHEQCGRRS